MLLKITQSILQLHVKSLQTLLGAHQKEFCEYLAYSRRYANFSVSIFLKDRLYKFYLLHASMYIATTLILLCFLSNQTRSKPLPPLLIPI